MQAYGQSCLYLHICLGFFIITTEVSLEKNIPCSKSHLDTTGEEGQSIKRWWKQHQNVFTIPLQIFTINQALRMSRMTHTYVEKWSMLYQQICSRCTRNVPQFGTSQTTATGWRSLIEKGSLQASYPRAACRSAVPWPCFSVGGQCDRACSGATGNGSVLQRAAMNLEGKKRSLTMQVYVRCDVMEHLRRHVFENQNVGNFKTDTTLEEEIGLIDTCHSTRPTASPLQNRQFQYLSLYFWET